MQPFLLNYFIKLMSRYWSHLNLHLDILKSTVLCTRLSLKGDTSGGRPVNKCSEYAYQASIRLKALIHCGAVQELATATVWGMKEKKLIGK